MDVLYGMDLIIRIYFWIIYGLHHIYIYIYGLHVIIENGVHWHILGSYGVAIMDIFFLPWALVDMFSPLPQLGLARILVTDGTDTQSTDLEVYGCLVVEHDWMIFPEILGIDNHPN